MAVMLRTLGIPSRVVNGFQRGEWNPYGRYFMVRLRDAHSWVEAYIQGRGWMTFDPTPPGAAIPQSDIDGVLERRAVALAVEHADRLDEGFPLGVDHRQFHIDVLAPGGDQAPLRDHLVRSRLAGVVQTSPANTLE